MRRVSYAVGMACLILLFTCPAAHASFITFDRLEYSAAPGDTVTVQVQFVVPVGTVASVAAVSAKVRISGGDVPGEVSTTLTDIGQAVSGTYILDNSTGFFPTLLDPTVAIGGDATPGANETKLPGTYAFMDLTWNISNDAFGDYFLGFDDVGLGIAGSTFLADTAGTDYLTHAVGAVIHVVPEPGCLTVLLPGALWLARRRHS